MSSRTRHRGTTDATGKPKRLQCEKTDAAPLANFYRLLPRQPSAAYAYEASENKDILLPFADGLLILSEQAGDCCLPPTAKVLCALVDGKIQFYSRHSLTTRQGLDLLPTTDIPFIPRTASECANILKRWHHYHQHNSPPFNTWTCLVVGATSARKHASDADEAARRCAMIIRSGGGTVLDLANEELDCTKLVDMQVTHLLVADEVFKPIKVWVEQNALSPIDVMTFGRVEELILSDEFFIPQSGATPSAEHGKKPLTRNLFPIVKTNFLSSTAELIDTRLKFMLQNLMRAPPQNKTSLTDVEGETLNHIEDQLGDRAKCTDDSLFTALSLLPMNDVVLPVEIVLHMFRVALEGYSAPSAASIAKQEEMLAGEETSSSSQNLNDLQEDIFFNGCAFLRWFALWQENNIHHFPTTRRILTEVCRTLCRQYARTTSQMLEKLKIYSNATKAKIHATSLYNFMFMLLTDNALDIETIEQINHVRGATDVRKQSKRSSRGGRAATKPGKRAVVGASSKIIGYDKFAEEDSSSSSSSSEDDDADSEKTTVEAEVKKSLSNIKSLSDGKELLNASNQISLAQLKIERFLVQRLAAERFVQYLRFDLSTQIMASNLAAELGPETGVAANSMEVDSPSRSTVRSRPPIPAQSVITARAQQCFSSPLKLSPAIVTLLFPVPAGVAAPKQYKISSNSTDDVVVVEDDEHSGSLPEQGVNKPPANTAKPARRGRGGRRAPVKINTAAAGTVRNSVRISPTDDIQFVFPRVCDDLALRLVKLIENEIKLHVALHSPSSAAAEEIALPENFTKFDGLHQFLVLNKTFASWLALTELIFDGVAYELCTHYSSGSPSATQQYILSITMPMFNTFACKLYEYCSLMPKNTEDVRLAVFMSVAETTRQPLLRNAVLKCYIVADSKNRNGGGRINSAFISRFCSVMPFESVCRLLLKFNSTFKSSAFELADGSLPAKINHAFISLLLRATHDVNIKPFIGTADSIHTRVVMGVAKACDANVITLADFAAVDGMDGLKKNEKLATHADIKPDNRWKPLVHDIVLRIMKDVGGVNDFGMETLFHFGESYACYYLMRSWLTADMFAHSELYADDSEIPRRSTPPSSVQSKKRGRGQIIKEEEKHDDIRKQTADKWNRIQQEFFS